MTLNTTNKHAPDDAAPTSAGPAFLRLLYAAVALCAMLIGAEIIHYLRATDFGNLDNLAVAWIGYHPQCSPAMPGVLTLTCPLNGYNSVQLQCWSSACTYRDPNDLPLTESMRRTREKQLKEDARNSWAIEPTLATSKQSTVQDEFTMPPRPQTMPGALEYMYYRDMLERHRIVKQLEGR